jgi:pimeloyl-ACP methyl ester carboxylesterase
MWWVTATEGIEALLLAIRHPTKVRKIVAVGPTPIPEGVKPDALEGMRGDPERS